MILRFYERSRVDYFAGHRIKGALASVSCVLSFQTPLPQSRKQKLKNNGQSVCSLKEDSLGTVLSIFSFLQKPVHSTSMFCQMVDVLEEEEP